jgi:hypothetical protein
VRDSWFWLKIVITITMLIVLLAALDWQEAVARLRDVSQPLTLVAVGLNTLAILD